MRWIVCIAICLATVGCSVSTQPESARTVAAFEVPLSSEADREQFLAILRGAAAAEGMHVDLESEQDLENDARASPLLEKTLNVAVWRGANDDELIASAMDQHDHLGQVWIMFSRGKDRALSRKFRARAMGAIKLRWPDTLSLPIMPTGAIPLHADLVRMPTGYIIKPSEAHKYQLQEGEKQRQGDPLTGQFTQASAVQNQPTFDETRGAILEGDAAHELVEQCGDTIESKHRLSSADIKRLDQELAPLLAADLKRAGSGATPHEYYRQYAAGRIGKWDAIFVNGFHESYFSGPFSATEYATWRRQLVSVDDGGTHYWCAIYSRGIKGHFVRFNKEGGGEGATHVAFHGLG
jgi:hypothetical protein